MNTPFDPLLPQRLPSPQNPDVSALQDEVRGGLFGNVLPNFASLFSLEQSLVDLDFDQVPRLELLTYFLKNRFRQARLSYSDACTKVMGFGLTHDVGRDVQHFRTPDVDDGDVLVRHQTGEYCRT